MITGLAFILGFSTVTISHVNAYSLAANAILAMGLVAANSCRMRVVSATQCCAGLPGGREWMGRRRRSTT